MLVFHCNINTLSFMHAFSMSWAKQANTTLRNTTHKRGGKGGTSNQKYIGDISTISHYHMCISEKSKNIMCWFSKSRSCFLNNFDFVHEAARRTCAASYVRASVRHPLI